MAVEVEKLLVVLEAKIDGYQRDLTTAQAATASKLGAIEQRYASFADRLKGTTSSAALGIGGLFSGIAAYLSVSKIIEYADAWNAVTRSLESSQTVFGLQLRDAAGVAEIAQRSRSDLEAINKLYIRTAISAKDLGLSEQQAADAVETFGKALKLGQADANEQRTALVQFSQALQKGKLDGDEFRTIMETAGVVQEALARKFNATKGELIDMGRAGKLVGADLLTSLLDIKDTVDEAFRTAPLTVGEALENLSTSVIKYVGELNQAHEITATLNSGILFLADNMDRVGNSALVAGAAILAAFGPRKIASVGAMAIGTAAAAGPFGLIAGALAAAAAALQIFGTAIEPIPGEMATITDYFNAVISLAGDQIGPAFATAQDYIVSGINVIIGALGGAEVSFNDLLTAMKIVANGMIGQFVAAGRIILATFTALPQAVLEQMIDMVNSVVAHVESMINYVIEALNTVTESFAAIVGETADIISKVDLGRVENNARGAGAAFGAAFVGAADDLTRDYLGNLGAAIRDRANQLALDRTFAAGTTVTRGFEETAPRKSSQKDGKLNEFEKQVREYQKKIELLNAEADAIGRGAFETEKAVAAAELLNDAKRAELAITPELLAQIDQLADAYARTVTETEALKDAFNQIRDESRDVLKGFITDLKDGKSGADALAGALNKIADKLIDMAVDGLVDAALGGLTGSTASAGSGTSSALLKLFGFAGGGVMTPSGPRQLERFARGGVSTRAAIFGESGPEAAVPLPDGRRIPVELRVPQALTGGGGQALNLTVAPVFNVQNGTPEGITKLRTEIAQAMPGLIKREVGQLFDRNARFARSKI